MGSFADDDAEEVSRLPFTRSFTNQVTIVGASEKGHNFAYVGLLLDRLREHHDEAVFLRFFPTIRAYPERHRSRQGRQRDGKETDGNGSSDALHRACTKLISRVEKLKTILRSSCD